MIKSQLAVRNGIPNLPSAEEIENMQKLAVKVLQPIRDHFGVVNVSSGFRSLTINSLTGGSDDSDHTRGMAADIECPGVSNKELAEWIAKNLKFKQLILEFHNDDIEDSGWVHVSYDENNPKMQVLRARKNSQNRTYYTPGLA
jgi:hypothetical protein